MPIKRILFVFLLCNLLISCSLTKYVPQNETLLNRVKIKKDTPDIDASALKNYVLQLPNSYMLGFMRTKLAIYNLSGKDTTKWSNRTLRKLGEEPIIFDLPLAENSQNAINQALKNKGYLNSVVTADISTKKKKTNVTYNIVSGAPYIIGRYQIDIQDDTIKNIINRIATRNPLEDKNFDVDLLNENRTRIVQVLRRMGYYNVQKENFAYTADTSLVKNYVDLKLILQQQYAADSVSKMLFRKKKIDKITIYCFSGNNISQENYLTNLDTIEYNGYRVIYNQKKHIFTPQFLTTKTLLFSNQTYNERMVERTNSNFSSLAGVKYVNIGFTEKEGDLLDCSIFVSPSDRYGYSIEVEGTTNTSGDLGAGLKLGFVDKNVFHGAETFRIGANTSYEALHNDGVWTHSYSVGGEVNLTTPQILLPFITDNFRRRHGGSTTFAVNYLYQNLPRWYERHIANASMIYNWQQRNSKYSFSLIDLIYVYLPSHTERFAETYLQETSPNRSSYENHLITRMGFGYSTTNRRTETSIQNFYTFRTSIKTAGNVFYALSNLTKQEKKDSVYKIFKTPYAQFVKGDFDYSYHYFASEKTRLVLHAAFGIGFPYGNSKVMPYEERYYSGGANSLRGWDVRTLGPGAYASPNSNYFMNQAGDIKLELNFEARFKLFWVIEAAAFVDAGNIWTIKNYQEQAGGAFLFTRKNVEKYNEVNKEYALQKGLAAPNSVAPFYEQIACSYGIGIRADFSFFVLRFDVGVKLHDPKYAASDERWRTSWATGKEFFKKDVSFCFAVGYPF